MISVILCSLLLQVADYYYLFFISVILLVYVTKTGGLKSRDALKLILEKEMF